MVARPLGVSPSIIASPAAHVKWSLQFWRRGWNSGTSVPVSGSWPVVRLALHSLHGRQHMHKFSNSSRPSRDRGRMWSIESDVPLIASAVRQ